MTIFRTCTGCRFNPGPCEPRETLRQRIKGLGVSSIKFKCKFRVSRFKVGDPVWVLTVSDRSANLDEYGEPPRDYFPGLVVQEKGSRTIVCIKEGAPGRDDEDLLFVPGNGSGFCNIPLSRLEPRDAPKERVCFYCRMPESVGHPEGYYCSAPAGIANPKYEGGEN